MSKGVVSEVGGGPQVALGDVSSPEHLREILREKASEFSNDPRIRRELRRALRDPDAICDESAGPVFTPKGWRHTALLHFTRLVRDEVGKPKGGARHPSVFDVKVDAQPDDSGQWYAQAKWATRQDQDWCKDARLLARQVRKDQARRRSAMNKPVPDGPGEGFRRTRGPAPPRGKVSEDQAERFFKELPRLAKALGVASISPRHSGNHEVVITFKDGTEVSLVLGDVTEFAADGFPKKRGEGVFTSLKAWDSSSHDLKSDGNPIPHASTLEGRKRVFLLSAVKALAPHVARHRGFDPDAYTDRAVAIAGFDLYHPLWPKADKKAQLAVRAEMLAAVGRNLRRRKDALAGKADDLPENVVPHASVAEHYHGGWWQKRRPHHFDVPPTGIPLAANARYAAAESLEEFAGALVSRDHDQTMRYAFGAFPSWFGRFVPLHFRFALACAAGMYTGPLQHALEPRTAKFVVPGVLTGLAEANFRDVGALFLGTNDAAASSVVTARRNVLAATGPVGDILDPPAHVEQRVANLAGDELVKDDPLKALAAFDKRSRDFDLVLAGLASEIARLSLAERKRLLAEIWEQQQAILAWRKSLADRKPAAFQSDSTRPSGAPSVRRLVLARGSADFTAAGFATMFAWAAGHLVDAALTWSYAVAATASAALFPMQQQALAKDRDAGAVKTALAAQREADNARFAVLSLLATGEGITLPDGLAEYLKHFDSSELKPWTPHLGPFLRRPLLMAWFVIPAAATPLFFEQIRALVWGHLASNAIRLPVNGLSSWLFFRKLVLRGQEFQRVTDKADRLDNVPADLAWLRKEGASLTTEIKEQTREQRAYNSMSRVLDDPTMRQVVSVKAATAMQKQLASAGNDLLIRRFAQSIAGMDKYQIDRYCRQLVPAWTELTPEERGRQLALECTLQYEKDVVQGGRARLAWLNADEYLPPFFQLGEVFPPRQVTPRDREQLALFRTICSLRSASVANGRRLAAVLNVSLLRGGWTPGVGRDGGTSFLRESNSAIDAAKLNQLLPVVDRLVERDIELLMLGFDSKQLVDMDLAALGPRGKTQSRRVAEHYLDKRLEDSQYRQDYVGAKSQQLIKIRGEVVESRRLVAERQKQKEKAERNGFGFRYKPRKPQQIKPSEFGWDEYFPGQEKVVDDSAKVRAVIEKLSAVIGFDDSEIEILQSVKNGLLPTLRDPEDDQELLSKERVYEDRVYGESVCQKGMYDVITEIVHAPDSEMVITQLQHSGVEVAFTQADLGTCTFRLMPTVLLVRDKPWTLSLQSLEMKEKPSLRLRTNYRPIKSLRPDFELDPEYDPKSDPEYDPKSDPEYDPESDPELDPYSMLNLKPAPAPSPHQHYLPNEWSGGRILINRHGPKQLSVQR